MPQSIQQFSDTQRLHRYQLVACLPGEMAGQLHQQAQAFEAAYQLNPARQEQELLLAEFSATEEMEETLIRWLQRITAELKGFGVTLNNYSGIPPHTVFLRVLDHAPFRRIAALLEPIDYYVKSNQCPPVRFIQQPYLAVGRGLPPLVYEQAIADYAGRDFHEQFEVTELMLMRRSVGEDHSSLRALLPLQSL